MASSLAYDTMQVVAREVQAFGGSEVLGLAAIAFAIFIGGFVAVALWQIVGKYTFKLLMLIPWRSIMYWCCCGHRLRKRRKDCHTHQHKRNRSRDLEHGLVGEVVPRQNKAVKDRPRHPAHNLWQLFILIGSVLIMVSATFWALHVMHTPFSILASLGIFGYIFGQAARPIFGNAFCGIIFYWTDIVELGDYIEIPGGGKGVVMEMTTLWIRLDDPNDDASKEKKIYLTNLTVFNGPLYRYDKHGSLLNTKTK